MCACVKTRRFDNVCRRNFAQIELVRKCKKKTREKLYNIIEEKTCERNGFTLTLVKRSLLDSIVS